METVAGAQSVAMSIQNANAAAQIARALIQQIKDDEEEEAEVMEIISIPGLFQ